MEIAAELRALAGNLWWSWHPDVIALFRDLDPSLWRSVNHNPIAFLSRYPAEKLEGRAVDLALELDAFRRKLEYPGENQRDHEASEDHEDVRPEEPLRHAKGRQQDGAGFDQDPRDQGVRRRQPQHVAALQFR